MKLINKSIKFNYCLKDINVAFEMLCANSSTYYLNHTRLKRQNAFSNLWKIMVNWLGIFFLFLF